MATSTTIATLSDTSGNSVEITFYKLDHDYNKQITSLGVPKSTDSNNVSPTTSTPNPLTLNIDLTKLLQVITISGYLLEETASAALAKKDALEKILSSSDTLTLEWKVGTTTITKKGSVIKSKITESSYRVGDEHPLSQGKSFLITLQFGVGSVKG